MAFDLQNFGIGLLTGWGTAYILYRARHRISAIRQSAGAQANRAQNYATRSADNRYINDLVTLCETNHLAGQYVKLSNVLVEPRFIPPPQLADPDSNEVVEDVYNLVPRAHDYPYLHAVYNIDTLSIDELSTGNRALALLGAPGSGRTTAMMAIILYCLNQVEFTPPKDKVQQRLDAEIAKLDDKARAQRAKEELAIEQRVKERLAEERDKDGKTAEEAQKMLASLFFRLMPVYVHLGDLVNRLKQFGTEVDPAEPLVRALQAHVGRITASTIPLNLYKRLNKGEVLLLVDGYDDLPESERPKALAWLQNLIAQYKDNFFIVAGPVRGYGQLTRLGLSPVFMRPWSDLDMERAARHYAENWARFSGKKRRDAKTLDNALRERALTNNRGLTPLQATLKIWANYADDADLPGVEGWVRAYLSRILPPDQTLTALLPQMAQIAALQLEEGFIIPARLEAVTSGASGIKPAKKTDTQEETAASTSSDEKDDEKKAQETETGSAMGRLLGLLRRSGVLTRYRGDRYQFRYASVCSYLASLTLKDLSEQKLLEKSNQSAWNLAFVYAAAHTSLDAVVQARMNASGDLLQTPLLDTARWLAHAQPDVPWRARLLKQIDTILTAPNQYPLLRERAAAALAGTRDKDVLLLFRRAARNTNAHLRRLACLGMGVTGDPEAIKDLVPLMHDQDTNVRLTAAMALAPIGTEAALEQMVVAFTEHNPPMQQAMAIAFAALPDEGFPVLFDAISDPEESIRRAAIYGLQRVNTKWALVSLYHTFLEDDRWQVRDAAMVAFTEMQYGRETKTAAYPPAEKIGWLSKWAASKGENLPPGEGATLMLTRVLQEGDPTTRALAATVMGQIGLAPLTRQLYNALRDRQDEVRVAAHKALAELQMQIGQPLPGAG